MNIKPIENPSMFLFYSNSLKILKWNTVICIDQFSVIEMIFAYSKKEKQRQQKSTKRKTKYKNMWQCDCKDNL